jgi:hypothetical protein
LVAVTIRVEELPELIEAGLAVISTVGDGVLKWIPQPEINRERKYIKKRHCNIR